MILQLLLLAAAATTAALAPLLDSPVYSLSTIDASGAANMNLVTYASPVGIRPERIWAVSLYRGTRSHENFAARRRGVLQVLRPEHAALTWTLGGYSGPDKRERCEALGFPWIDDEDGLEEALLAATTYVCLEEIERFNAGDHDVSLCRVSRAATTPGDCLTTATLRARGLVTELGRAVELPSARVRHRDPDIFVYEDVLSHEDCERLIEYATKKRTTRSNPPAAQFDARRLALLAPLVAAAPAPAALRVFEDTADVAAALATAGRVLLGALATVALAAAAVAETATRRAAARRTSSAVALNTPDDLDFALPVARKVAAILNTTIDHLEAPVVSRYEPGDLFAVHNDASARPDRDWGDQGGQRLKTCILYLNDVPRGGATTFDQLDNLQVQPVAGAACVFFPADPRTRLPDDRTTHASAPAIDPKWICQLWQRETIVPPPLGLPEPRA
ncbi:hypothetical protein CTAYLR_001025 [Chrysophaeum taylorii]|uniref:Fe2OG dioxygenase domain-containing protein n=1 Tax=Chrysophaeum taylorii TaxID=2483200 RepID=A0AAD7XMW7_9STRA|nr:hypothetical protein CTAYLR_001025 [Chrysophaeum taylorii]